MLTEEQIEQLGVTHESFGYGLCADPSQSTHSFYPKDLVSFARAIEQAVRKEMEGDAKDAERYRWLRDASVPPHNFYLSVPIEFDGVRYGPHEVDAYIDAARGQTCGG